jgi:hypothetical protein
MVTHVSLFRHLHDIFLSLELILLKLREQGALDVGQEHHALP